MAQNGKAIAMGVLWGLLAGLSVDIGGAIKDSPIEGFKPITFLRSPIIGAIEGGAIRVAKNDLHPAFVYLSTIGTERITVESWKLIRSQVPGKFENGEWGKPVLGQKIQFS